MAMQDQHILIDCLETMKHLAMTYQATAFECDSDALRKTLEKIQVDKDELRNAVFNLMHQMGIYQTQPADTAQLTAQQQNWQKTLGSMQKRLQTVKQGESFSYEPNAPR